MNEPGAYSLQVVDSTGHPVHGIILRTPAIFLYHYQPAVLTALDINANQIVMSWPSLIQAAQAARQPLTSLIIPLSNDSRTHTLSGQSRVLGPGIFDQVATPQVQSPPPVLLASVSGNTGQLSYTYPLQVPPGAMALLLNSRWPTPVWVPIAVPAVAPPTKEPAAAIAMPPGWKLIIPTTTSIPAAACKRATTT